jgi:protein involved in polysaccharide export with SLBB domain
MTSRHGLPALLLLAALAIPSAAGPATAPSTRPADPATGGDAAAAADPIVPGDLLVIAYPELSPPGTDYLRPSRVSADGSITVPVAGDLKVSGLTLAAAENAINRALRETRVIAHPAVSIDRHERAAAASVAPGPVAAGDVLRVSIWEIAGPGVETVRTLHVSAAGEVGLPLLGQTKLAGLTEAAAEAAVVKAYADARMVQQAIVSVLRVKPPQGVEPVPTPAHPAGGRGR